MGMHTSNHYLDNDGKTWKPSNGQIRVPDGAGGYTDWGGTNARYWAPKDGVTENPVWYQNAAIAISAGTVTEHLITGANVTAVEVQCYGDATFEGVEVVLNAANTTDAWAEIGAASGTSSLAYFCYPGERVLLPLANLNDSTLELTAVHFGAVGSAVNNIRLRFA